MAYETSYDVGLKPFKPDKHRGTWSSSKDFFFACVGHAFKIEAAYILPSVAFQDAGYTVLLPYSIVMLVCTIPIIFIQSFLGQFSSTGFISVFRITPLFKGLGYLSLALNIATLTYCSIFAALPLFFFFHSMRPTLPWNCEGADNLISNARLCNTTNNEKNPTPSLKFFMEHIDMRSFYSSSRSKTFSLSLIVCSFIIWAAVWFVVRKPTARVGQIIRYSTLTMLATLTICVIRFAFLPGALAGLHRFYDPRGHEIIYTFLFLPLLALSGLGPGWGSILTMASYNKFKTDITKHTWFLALGQFGLMVLGSLSWMFIENFLLALHPTRRRIPDESRRWMQFMTVPTALSYLEMPHFWSLLYFGMLTAGATTLLIVQLYSTLTSLFDEFEALREKREQVIHVTATILALCSTLYCSNFGVPALIFLSRLSITTQTLLNLMMLLVVLWIYGRVRLQRDLKFMINRTYPTWMVFIVRFVAPICLLCSLLFGLITSAMGSYIDDVISICIVGVIVLPWLFIPVYCVLKIKQTTGLIGRRLRKSVQPTDWYPVDPDNRQKYEEAFGKSEISHQLTVTSEGYA